MILNVGIIDVERKIYVSVYLCFYSIVVVDLKWEEKELRVDMDMVMDMNMVTVTATIIIMRRALIDLLFVMKFQNQVIM